MAVKYHEYLSYEDRHGKWFGPLPSHWNAAPVKFQCTYNDEVLSDALPDDYEIEYVDIGSVTASEGISKVEQLLLGKAPSRARRIVRDGDVIVSTVRTYLEAIAPIVCPSNNLVVSTGFAVIRPKKSLHKKYAAYALRAKGFIEEVVARSVGISYPAINASDLVAIYSPVPGLEEQQQIANFLDHETAKIDTLIDKQQQLIKLLKEKRQAVISHAVTKGLNPEARMKDSGVEWLGEVPEHWGVVRARYLFKKEERQVVQGMGVITAYRDGQVCLRTKRRADGYTMAILEHGYQRIIPGDLVIHGMDAFAGAIGVSEDDGKSTPEYVVLSPQNDNVCAEFYAHILRLMALRDYIYVICPSVRERAPRFRFPKLQNVFLPIPPILEQHAAVRKINKNNKLIGVLIGKAMHQIALLQERRTALISAAVTGKIDVRNWRPEQTDKTQNSSLHED